MKKIIIVSLFLFCGCVTGEEMRGLLVLKSVSGNQAQQDKVIRAQEDRFNKLLNLVKADQLKDDRSKKWIIANFGEPQLISPISDNPVEIERFMYRHPAEFFGSERAYLYFDKEERLVGSSYQEGY